MRKTVGDYGWTTLFEGYLWGARYSERNNRCCSKASLKRYQISKMAVEHYDFWKSNERIWGLSNCFDIGYRKSKIEIDPSIIYSETRNDFLFARSFYRGFNFIVLWNYLENLDCTPIPRICVTRFAKKLLRSCYLSLSLSLSLFS